MSAVLNGIRSRVGPANCSNSCGRNRCQVNLTDVPADHVIVDADKAFPAHGWEGKRCDFILFVDCDGRPLLAALLELKSGRTDALDAAKQLQGGAHFAARFASPSETDCLPVLFHGKGLDRIERDRLNRAKITFHGRKLTVRTARCNAPRNLARVLPR